MILASRTHDVDVKTFIFIQLIIVINEKSSIWAYDLNIIDGVYPEEIEG